MSARSGERARPTPGTEPAEPPVETAESVAEDAPDQMAAVDAFAVDQAELDRFIRTVMRVTGCDYDLAQDIAQEVALRAMVLGRHLPSKRAWFAYLVDAARNVYRNRLKTGDRDAQRFAALAVDTAAAAQQAARRGDLSTQLADREEWEAVLADIRALPDRQRQAVELRYLDGLPPRVIAERLGADGRQVETMLRDGKKKLQAAHRRRQAGMWYLALASLRQRSLDRAGVVEAAASSTQVVVIGAVTLSVVAVLGAPPTEPAAAQIVRRRLPARHEGRATVVGKLRAVAGPGAAADQGVVGSVARDSVAPSLAAPGPATTTRLWTQLPKPGSTACVRECEAAPLSGDVLYVKLLPGHPGVGENVTPLCQSVPDNPAVACRRGQEPERWWVKEIPPLPPPSGSTA